VMDEDADGTLSRQQVGQLLDDPRQRIVRALVLGRAAVRFPHGLLV
jgi:hypothetical protein